MNDVLRTILRSILKKTLKKALGGEKKVKNDSKKGGENNGDQDLSTGIS